MGVLLWLMVWYCTFELPRKDNYEFNHVMLQDRHIKEYLLFPSFVYFVFTFLVFFLLTVSESTSCSDSSCHSAASSWGHYILGQLFCRASQSFCTYYNSHSLLCVDSWAVCCSWGCLMAESLWSIESLLSDYLWPWTHS